MFGRSKQSKPKPPVLPDGRKYRLVIISMMILLSGFAMASMNPVLASLLPELITGILGLNLLYNGGNIGNKWVLKGRGGLQMGSGQPVIAAPPPVAPRGCECNKLEGQL